VSVQLFSRPKLYERRRRHQEGEPRDEKELRGHTALKMPRREYEYIKEVTEKLYGNFVPPHVLAVVGVKLVHCLGLTLDDIFQIYTADSVEKVLTVVKAKLGLIERVALAPIHAVDVHKPIKSDVVEITPAAEVAQPRHVEHESIRVYASATQIAARREAERAHAQFTTAVEVKPAEITPTQITTTQQNQQAGGERAEGGGVAAALEKELEKLEKVEIPDFLKDNPWIAILRQKGEQ